MNPNKKIRRFGLFLIFLLSVSIVRPAAAAGLFEPGETSYWMGTYFKGKKLGFSYAKIVTTEDAVNVSSKVFFKLKSQGVDQTTTFSQETHLTPELELKRFTLLQEIMGSRQKVDGRVKDGRLKYRVTGLGFDKTQSVRFPASALPSTTFLLNIVKDGLAVGKKGRRAVFLEPFQMFLDLQYEVLRKETVKHEGRDVKAFVMKHQMSGMESTLWIAENGTVLKEVTSQGFESRLEPEHVARKLGDDAMSISSLITLSIVKIDQAMPRPGEKRRLKMKLSKLRAPDLIPQDHRQKVLRSEVSADGTHAAEILVSTEPDSVARPSVRPVAAFSDPALLAETPEVQSKHRLIRTLAKELVGDVPDAWEASKTINQWVYNNLEKSLVDSVSALNALKQRKGECQSHTYLFTALARAAGIPTKIVNGLVYSPQFQGFLYHAWPEVYVGEWRALDPTFGQDHVDATHIKLSEGAREGPFKLMEFVGKVEIDVLEN